MSLNSMNKEMRPVLVELRRQGWELNDTNNGHVTAYPPDKSKEQITFSRCQEPRAMRNTISQLKRSGFMWPPPKPERKPNDPDALIKEMVRTDVVESIDGAVEEVLSEEQLFRELCSARESFKIAQMLHDEAEAELLAAQKRVDDAKEELGIRREEFDLAKQIFTDYFDS